MSAPWSWERAASYIIMRAAESSVALSARGNPTPWWSMIVRPKVWRVPAKSAASS
jgi:hypothetical protein